MSLESVVRRTASGLCDELIIPKYAQMKIPHTSPASIVTLKKTQITRLREVIKFLYKKKDKLNEFLYRTHLQAAQEWGKTWDIIRDNIHNSLNLEAERIYKSLDDKISRLTSLQHEKIDEKFEFYPRVINQTDIVFTEEEQTLLNKNSSLKLTASQAKSICLYKKQVVPLQIAIKISTQRTDARVGHSQTKVTDYVNWILQNKLLFLIFIVSPCIFIYLLVFTNICTFIVIKILHKQSLM